MIQLGIIGTNWITHQFVAAALETKEYELSGVYSRTIDSAHRFARSYNGAIYCTDSLDEFLTVPSIDVVYIASPNSLHFSQAKAALLAGKHVIVEKPAFSTPNEMNEIVQLTKQTGQLFFEAARNIHEDSFNKVDQTIRSMSHPIGANFTYMKYSSRYDQVLAGEEPNIFSPKFSGGSVSDLGVYPIYAAVGWFGKPDKVHHFIRKIRTGVDGIGTIILRYEQFDVTIQHGKIAESSLPSEIYFEDATLFLNSVNAIAEATLSPRDGEIKHLAVEAKENPMVEEARAFACVLKGPNDATNQERYHLWLEMAIQVNDILFELRKQSGIHFTADEE